MGLFRRPDPPKQVVDVSLEDYSAMCRKLGRLEAQVESIELVWHNYRDQISRLIQRLEKREERQKKKDATQEQSENGPQIDPVSARIHARRKGYGLPRTRDTQPTR